MTVYPTYKDSGIEWQGQIPAHWDETLFFSVAKLKNQQVILKKIFSLFIWIKE